MEIWFIFPSFHEIFIIQIDFFMLEKAREVWYLHYVDYFICIRSPRIYVYIISAHHCLNLNSLTDNVSSIREQFFSKKPIVLLFEQIVLRLHCTLLQHQL